MLNLTEALFNILWYQLQLIMDWIFTCSFLIPKLFVRVIKLQMVYVIMYAFDIGNGDPSIPEGDGAKGNNSSEKSDDISQHPLHLNSDWREVRANLFAREQVMYFLL